MQSQEKALRKTIRAFSGFKGKDLKTLVRPPAASIAVFNCVFVFLSRRMHRGGLGGGSTQVKVVATSRANRKLNGQKAVQDRVSLQSLSSLSSELLMVLLVV